MAQVSLYWALFLQRYTGCTDFELSYWLSWDCRQEEKVQHVPKDSESGLQMLTPSARRRSFYHKTPSGRCKAEGSLLSDVVGSGCLVFLDPDPPSSLCKNGGSQCSHPQTHLREFLSGCKALAGVGFLCFLITTNHLAWSAGTLWYF